MKEVVSGQLKRSEVTEFYRISRTTLWRLAKTGKLKPVGSVSKKGEKLYSRNDIEKYQASML